MSPFIATCILAAPAFEARILWVDAAANLDWTIDAAKVRDFCRRAKDAGFNELVVDVKPINGKVLFAAPAEDRLSEFRGVRVPSGYDLLAEFTREGHAAGLRVSAGMNVFSEGHSHFPGVGEAYRNPEWQTKVAVPAYRAVLGNGETMRILAPGELAPKPGELSLGGGDKGFPLPGLSERVTSHPDDAARLAAFGISRLDVATVILPQTEAFPRMVSVFVDPPAPGVRERMLRLIQTACRYEVDGIVFDRMRYSALESGMGPAMRAEFERRYGPVASWPESVLAADPNPARPMRRGPRFADWMQFRAEVIAEFVRDATALIKSINPRIQVGSYVGAGWETYYEAGVNYAADRPEPRYEWAHEEYGLAGYADYLDFLTPGCFYPVAREVDVTVQGARERFTVEGAAKLMRQLSGSATLVYPALYGADWEKNPEGLREAIRACRKEGRGLMFFDAVYVLRNDWWAVFAEEFRDGPPLPPHAMPSHPRQTGQS